MEKKPQMLTIDPPNELKFVGPFDQPCITTIKLTNPTDFTILFKIKTTAPKKYCVRPNVGSVRAHASILIDICLQPKSLEPNEKNRHKFMVQSFAIPDGAPVTDPSKMWQEVNPEELADTKLKCVFELPGGEQRSDIDKNNVDLVASEKEIPLQVAAPKVIKEEPKEFSDKYNDNELRKAKTENSALKQENTKLQEQILRLKLEEKKQAFTPPSSVQEVPMIYILMSIVAAIVGVVLGKFLL